MTGRTRSTAVSTAAPAWRCAAAGSAGACASSRSTRTCGVAWSTSGAARTRCRPRRSRLFRARRSWFASYGRQLRIPTTWSTSWPRRRKCPRVRYGGSSPRQPTDDLVVYGRVVQQLKVVGAAEVHPVVHLERDPPPEPAASRARLAHEQGSHQRVRVAAERGADEVVRR